MQSAPITLTSYGTGNKPKIRSSAETVVGGTNLGGWTINGLAIECTSIDAINVGGQNTAIQFTYTGTGSYSNLSITNNEIYATNGIDTNTNGIRILTLLSTDITSRVLTNLNINNNLIYNIGWLGIASTGWNTTLNRDLFSRNLYGNVNVIGNTIHNTACQGITMHSLDIGFINNNLVYDCGQYTGTNVSWGTSGIWVMLASHVDITYNEVYGQSESNFKNYDASGFDIDWTCENINLSYNYAHDNKGPGIETMSNKNCTIMYNTLSGNNGLTNVGNGQITITSCTVNADAMTGLQNLNISYNTITVDKPNTVALCTNLITPGTWSGNNFSNNEITLTSGVSGIGVYNLGANTSINTNYNNIYSSNGTTFVGTKNGTIYNSIEAWRIGTTLDENSVTALINFAISAKQTMVTKGQRTSMGLNWWNDGCFGVVKDGANYSFYAANGSTTSKTTGTLDNIASSVSYSSKTIQNLKNTYNYAAGGPIYKDPSSGNLIMIYHFEKNRGGDYTRFYSGLGMAKSTDGGNSFVDLGEIITANVSYDSVNCPNIVEMMGGAFVIKDGYMYVYFADYLESGTVNSLSVARASLSDILTAAGQGNTTSFNKYYNGTFSQAGIGGLSSSLESGNPSTRWVDVTYNSYLNKFIMVVAQNTIGSQVNLFMTTSTDGINWGTRTQIETDAGESFYPTLVGTGNDPKITGTSFYLYYTHSVAGSFDRWSDAETVRRTVTIS